MMNRNEIICFLKEFAIGKPYVYALWLEGADGIGCVDEYSDLDFWFDVEKFHQEVFLCECITELEKLGRIDSRIDDIRPEIAQSNLHLENTSEYLTLDICVQSHELRGLMATCYVKQDMAELPLVLFDKKNIISFRDYQINTDEIRQVLLENKNHLLQMSRVVKYIRRGQYLEAYMKYLEHVAEPLVKTTRLLYTPRHYEYGLCHISRHLPADAVHELEAFYQVTSLEDIEKKLPEARQLFEIYEQKLQEAYFYRKRF